MVKYFTYLFYVKEHYSESVQQLIDTIFLQIGKTLPIFTSQKLGLSKINFFFLSGIVKRQKYGVLASPQYMLSAF